MDHMIGCFPERVYYLIFPSTTYGYSLPTLDKVNVLNFKYSNRYIGVSNWGLNLYSPSGYWDWKYILYIYICVCMLFMTHIFCLIKSLFKYLAILLGCLFMYNWIFKNVYISLNIKPLLFSWFVNIFSQSVDFLFILLMCFKQKSLSLL